MRPVNAPSWLVERPIAHRGLHDEARGRIENTLRAADAAIAGGFAIECDIQLSVDGEAIVFHDETLDRLTDAPGLLSALSAAEIAKLRIKDSGEPPPTFAGLSRSSRRPDADHLRAQEPVRRRLAHRRPRRRPRRDFMTARSPSRASTMILPPICACAARICGRASPARSAFSPRRLTTARTGISSARRRSATGSDFDHYDLARPDFLSWNVDDLPHKIPFLVKELTGAPIMAWTVRTAEQREAAHKWADQIVFDGDPEANRSWRRLNYVGALGY